MIELPGLFNYWAAVVLMMSGFYVVIAHNNLVKKLIGLGLFQTSVFVFYIAIGKVADASPPIYHPSIELYSNPLPHVLILTAIVVGVATAAVGLGLIVRIREAYGSIEDETINRMDREEGDTT